MGKIKKIWDIVSSIIVIFMKPTVYFRGIYGVPCPYNRGNEEHFNRKLTLI